MGLVGKRMNHGVANPDARAQKMVCDGVEFDVTNRLSQSANRRDCQKAANYGKRDGRRARLAERREIKF
ncbi:MAG TPA: hypothetical protein VGF61_16185 [Candidatus Acidoferrum sp.]|jgi:hypothetical protein